MRCNAKTGTDWTFRPQCSRDAKYPESDPLWCGQHDPARRKASQATRDAKWIANNEAKRAKRRREDVRRDLERRAYQALLDGGPYPDDIQQEIQAFEAAH